MQWYTSTDRLLLDRGASVSTADEDDKTPLYCLAEKGLTVTVQLLLEKGANTDAKLPRKDGREGRRHDGGRTLRGHWTLPPWTVRVPHAKIGRGRGQGRHRTDSASLEPQLHHRGLLMGVASTFPSVARSCLLRKCGP